MDAVRRAKIAAATLECERAKLALEIANGHQWILKAMLLDASKTALAALERQRAAKLSLRQLTNKRCVSGKENIIRLYKQHPKWTSGRLASELGTHPSYVRNVLRAARLPLAKRHRNHRLLPWERQAIADAYEKGEKLAALAAEFRVLPTSVSRTAERAGIPRRPRHHAPRSSPAIAA